MCVISALFWTPHPSEVLLNLETKGEGLMNKLATFVGNLNKIVASCDLEPCPILILLC